MPAPGSESATSDDTITYLRSLEVETAILRKLLRQIAVDVTKDGRRTSATPDSLPKAAYSSVVSTAFRRLAPDLSRIAARLDVSEFLTDSSLVDPSLVSEAKQELANGKRKPREVPLIEAVAHVSASIDAVLDALVESWHATSLHKRMGSFSSDTWGSSSSSEEVHQEPRAPEQAAAVSTVSEGQKPSQHNTTTATSTTEAATAGAGSNQSNQLDRGFTPTIQFNPVVREAEMSSCIPRDALNDSVLTALAMPIDNTFYCFGTPCYSRDDKIRAAVVAAQAEKLLALCKRRTRHTFVSTEDELYDKKMTHKRGDQTIGVLRAFRSFCDGQVTESPTIYGCVGTCWEPITWATLRLTAQQYGMSHPTLYSVFGDCNEAEGIALCVPHAYVVLSRYPFFEEHHQFIDRFVALRQRSVEAHVRQSIEMYSHCLSVSPPLGATELACGLSPDFYNEIRDRLKMRDNTVLELVEVKQEINKLSSIAETKGTSMTYIEFKRYEARQAKLMHTYSIGWHQLADLQTQLIGLCRTLVRHVGLATDTVVSASPLIPVLLAAKCPAPGTRCTIAHDSCDAPLFDFSRDEEPWRFSRTDFRSMVEASVHYSEPRFGTIEHWRKVLSVRNFIEQISPYSFGPAAAQLSEHSVIGTDLTHPETLERTTNFAVPCLLQYCSVENIVEIFEAALTEHNVVFMHPDLDVASRCVLAVNALLFPLCWQNNLRPAAPLAMMQALQTSGTEILAQANLLGAVSVAAQEVVDERSVDAVVVDLNNDKLWIQGDVLNLPSKDELLRHLREAIATESALTTRTKLVQRICSDFVRWLLAAVYISALPDDQAFAAATAGPLNPGCVVPVARLPSDDDLPGLALRDDAFWHRFANTQMIRQHHQVRTARAMVSAMDNFVPAFMTDSTKLVEKTLDDFVSAPAQPQANTIASPSTYPPPSLSDITGVASP